MTTEFSIIFPYRNRDFKRVHLALKSLDIQDDGRFEVIFVDYGSDGDNSEKIESIIGLYGFATYHYIAHPGLLWNKSKALNYGIDSAKTDFVVLADIDVLFAPNFIASLDQLKAKQNFTLFKIGYLSRDTTSKIETSAFSSITPTHEGDTFGIGLFPKKALVEVCGLDPFFHFYGSEDQDLNARLQHAGYSMKRCVNHLLLHQWHERYPQRVDEKLTKVPRLTNIQRINQRHFFWHKEKKVIKHTDKEFWLKVFTKQDQKKLKNPDNTIKIVNKEADVVHFLNCELVTYKGEVVKAIFTENEDFNSVKFRIKDVLGKNSQPHISLKQVNDLILEKLLFTYRHHNYQYAIADNLKEIQLTIDL